MPKKGSTVTAASTTSQKLFEYNGGRDKLIVQNQDSGATLYLNIDAPATIGGGNVMISPLQYWTETGITGAVYVIASAGAPAICAWET